MQDKNSALILAGAIAVAAAGGITYALVKPTAAPIATAPTSIVSPTVTASGLETPPPVVSTPTSKPTQPVAQQPAKPPAKPTSSESPSRKVELCKVTMVQVNDPESPLNVRSAPGTVSTQVVGNLKNGTYVSVESEKEGWLQISNPVQGWISANRTKKGCNEKVERIQLNAGQMTQISDRFVGTGSHRYVLAAKQGQKLTVKRTEGPFPFITGPDGKLLVEGLDENRPQWSGQLPAAGEYTIQLDSNYKGYSYDFSVEMQ